MPFRQFRLVHQAIALYDLERGVRRDLSARLLGEGGSGRGVLPSGPELAFAKGQLRFTNVIEGVKAGDFRSGKDEEWIIIDLETQEEVSCEPRGAWSPPAEPGAAPDYLKELAAVLPGAVYGEHHELAMAAMVHHKIIDPEEAREPGKFRFSFVMLSPEGDQLLALLGKNLHYFDFKARTHRAEPAPPALQNVICNACAVVIP